MLFNDNINNIDNIGHFLFEAYGVTRMTVKSRKFPVNSFDTAL